MESISSEQSATVDELLEACIQAFGWSTHLTRLLSHSDCDDLTLMKLPTSVLCFDFRRVRNIKGRFPCPHVPHDAPLVHPIHQHG